MRLVGLKLVILAEGVRVVARAACCLWPEWVMGLDGKHTPQVRGVRGRQAAPQAGLRPLGIGAQVEPVPLPRDTEGPVTVTSSPLGSFQL